MKGYLSLQNSFKNLITDWLYVLRKGLKKVFYYKMQTLEKWHGRIGKLHYMNMSEFLFACERLFLMEHILKKSLPLLTALFLSSWNRKCGVDRKSYLFPSWSKPSLNLGGNTYGILLFSKGAVIILIFQKRALRLQET